MNTYQSQRKEFVEQWDKFVADLRTAWAAVKRAWGIEQ